MEVKNLFRALEEKFSESRRFPILWSKKSFAGVGIGADQKSRHDSG